AAAAYSTCLALNPDFHDAYLLRGKAYLALHYWHLAQADFTQLTEALRARLKKGAPVQTALAHAYLRRAEAYQGLRDFPGALRDLDEAVRLVEGFTEAHFRRAKVREALGDDAGAQADLHTVIRSEPANARGWIMRAQARGEDVPGALTDLERALQIEPYCYD